MSIPTFKMAVRLRLISTALAMAGMFAAILMVGALFPAVGGSIGKLDLPKGVTDLLGGADYGNLRGWMRSEIGAVYGPLVIAATGIAAASGSLAGEEESGILGVILAHPVKRSRLVLAKGAAVAVDVLLVALGTLVGLIAGVAAGGGGIALGDLIALCIHLAFFGLMFGALALALAGMTGRKAIASGAAASFGVAAFLINGFAPLVDQIDWLKYLSPFHYYSGHDPISNGLDIPDLAVLALVTISLTLIAVLGFGRRDLHG